jgi:hypothetical protein
MKFAQFCTFLHFIRKRKSFGTSGYKNFNEINGLMLIL